MRNPLTIMIAAVLLFGALGAALSPTMFAKPLDVSSGTAFAKPIDPKQVTGMTAEEVGRYFGESPVVIVDSENDPDLRAFFGM